MTKSKQLKDLIFLVDDRVADLMFGLGIVKESDWALCVVEFDSGFTAEYSIHGVIKHEHAKNRTLYHSGTRIDIDDRELFRRPDFKPLQYVLHAKRGEAWTLYQFSHVEQENLYEPPKCIMVGGFSDVAANFIAHNTRRKIKPGDIRQ